MNNQQVPRSEKDVALNKVKAARGNLLLMLAFTVVNIVLLFTGSDVMMLFSASVPYFSTIIAMTSETSAELVMFAGITIIILLVYLLCWINSKKHYGWMICALVFFVIDTVALIALYVTTEDFSGILDFVIHIWVLFYLVTGVKYGKILKNMPEETEIVTETAEYQPPVTDAQFYNYSDSTPLRRANTEVKNRTLLECNWNGHQICYRRVKRVNEFVIDGYVYAEIEALVEFAHELDANMDGHALQVGFDGVAHSFFKVDGNTISQKARLY